MLRKKRKKRLYTTQAIRKSRKVMLRFPMIYKEPIKELCKKYGIRGVQDLFDYLIVSGICFRKTDIINIVRENREQYEAEFAAIKTKNLKDKDNTVRVVQYGVNVSMFDADHKAFKDYLIEENIRQQTVIKILFLEGFLKEDKRVIDLIETNKSLRINARKKNVLRLSGDKYIAVLGADDSRRILDELTEEYDSKSFDSNIEKMVKIKIRLMDQAERKRSRLIGCMDSEEDDEDLDAALNMKARVLRTVRTKKINKIVAPIDLDAND